MEKVTYIYIRINTRERKESSRRICRKAEGQEGSEAIWVRSVIYMNSKVVNKTE